MQLKDQLTMIGDHAEIFRRRIHRIADQGRMELARIQITYNTERNATYYG